MPQYLTSDKPILEIEDFLRKKTYVRVDSDVDTIIEHLNKIGSIDKQCEKSQKNAGIAAICCITVSIILCTVPGIGPVALLVGFIAAIAFGGAHAEHARLNVEDERYMLAGKLLEMLKRDLSPKSSVSVTADFRELNNPSNFARNVLRGRLFATKWLSIEGQFIDGTEFQLTITEFLKVNFHKSKQKHKGYRIDLNLTLRDARYARVSDVLANFKPKKSGMAHPGSKFVNQRLSEPSTENFVAPSSIKDLFNLPIGCKPVRLDFRGKRLMISVKMEPKPFMANYETTTAALYKVSASTLLTAYHLLNLARRISSAPPTKSA